MSSKVATALWFAIAALLVTLPAASQIQRQDGPLALDPRVGMPATLYVYRGHGHWNHCNDIVQVGGSEWTDLRQGQYIRAEVWPGSVTVRLDFRTRSCRFESRPMSDLTLTADIQPGANYIELTGDIIWGNGAGIQQVTPQRAEARVRQSTLVRSILASETALRLAGGVYYGPNPDADTPVWGQVVYDDRIVVALFSNGGAREGEVRYADGRSYSGAIRDGRPHGYGQLVQSDGRVFVGEFSNGDASGLGVCSSTSGAPEACEFVGGREATLETVAQRYFEEYQREQVASFVQAVQTELTARETDVRSRAEQLAEQRNPNRRSELEDRCGCALQLRICLTSRRSGLTAEEEAAEQRARERRTQQCRAEWAAFQASGADDPAALARLDAVETQLARERDDLAARRAQLEVQAQRRRAEIERERAQITARYRAQEQQRRADYLEAMSQRCAGVTDPARCECNVVRHAPPTRGAVCRA